MDGPIILLVSGVFVVSAAILYAVSLVSIKEQTYDEAMAEQRKRIESEFQKVKKDKPAVRVEKKNKKLVKKHKEKEKSVKSEATEAPPVVYFSPEQKQKDKSAKSDISETSASPEPDTKKVNKQKVDKVEKPAAREVEHVFEPVSDSVCAADHNEEDEEDLAKCEMEAEDVEVINSVNNETYIQKVSAPEPVMIEEKIVEPKLEVMLEAKPPAPAPKKKKGKQVESKATTLPGSLQDVNEIKLLPLIRRAPLTDGEIQNLIECLLNKQSGGSGDSEWIEKSGRPDPAVILKRQLEEKERALLNEQEASQAYQARLRDLRLEYNQEKSRSVQSKRLLDESISKHQQEIQALRSRLQMSLDQCATLQTKLQQVQSQVTEEHMLAVQRLQEEKKQLQQAFTAERNSLTSAEITRLQNELDQAHVARDQYQASLSTMQQVQTELHNKIRHLEDLQSHKESDMHKAVGDLQMKLNEVEGCKCALSDELAQLQSLHGGLESENSTLKQQITSLQSNTSIADENKRKLQAKVEECMRNQRESDDRLKQAQVQVEEWRKRSAEKEYENERLRLENEGLAEVVASAKERPAADGAEGVSAKVNGSQHPEIIAQDTFDGDASERLNEKEALLSTLNESLQREQSTVCSLREELRGRESDVSVKDQELGCLRKEIDQLSLQLEAQKQKNDALRVKNWKVAEALAVAEKSLESNMKEAGRVVNNEKELVMRREELQQTRAVLLRVFPSVTVDEKLDNAEWLKRFEVEALAVINKPPVVVEKEVEKLVEVERITEVDNPQLVDRVNSLLDDNKKLRGQATQYKTILGETEGILNRLQASVEAEEKVWHRKLSEKDRELNEVKREHKHVIQQCHQLEESMREIRAAEEMQEKLRELQQKLQDEEKEKDSLAVKYGDILGQMNHAKEQLENADKLKEGMAKLQEELDAEKKISRDLSGQTVKLNSLVKIGQDALKAEEERVRRLVEEVTSLKNSAESVPASNGPSIETQPQTSVEQNSEFGAKK